MWYLHGMYDFTSLKAGEKHDMYVERAVKWALEWQRAKYF